ncbi:MAG: hydroxymethylbilane synthase [Firmicutes bacterium]|nr:hydroxymethylbilane synthase [Bacillota bacterium]
MRVGTRTSDLARWQAEQVLAGLGRAGQPARLVGVRTRGDREHAPEALMAGEGAFVSALEEALVRREIDLAVHSLKDVPVRLAEGLVLAAVLPRHDPSDAVVGRPLRALPSGARVGTSSPRRAAFVRALRPDLAVVPVRGNVPRRVALVERGEVEAVVLALAGLERLGLGGLVAEVLPLDAFPPAPGQGAIAVEARQGEVPEAAVSLDDAPSRRAVEAERALLARLGGGCGLPLGAWARPTAGGAIRLTARLVDGQGRVREAEAEAQAPEEVAEMAARALGRP